MSRHLFLDGDAILWRVVEANQDETWWPGSDSVRTAACDTRQAALDFEEMVGDLAMKAGAGYITVVLGPWVKQLYFRCKLWPQYKTHRRRCDAPVGLHMVKTYVVGHDSDFVVAPPHLEADDVLARHMTDPTYQDLGRECVLWMPDKDAKQIPGIHMDDEGICTTVDYPEADYHHLFQTLTGDTADGYPGLKGCGPVGAAKILAGGNGWEAVRQAFRKAGQSDEDALVQARIARLTRYGEEPGAWTPT